MKIRFNVGHTNCHHTIISNEESERLKKVNWKKTYIDLQKRIIHEQRSDFYLTIILLFMTLCQISMFLFMISIY